MQPRTYSHIKPTEEETDKLHEHCRQAMQQICRLEIADDPMAVETAYWQLHKVSKDLASLVDWLAFPDYREEDTTAKAQAPKPRYLAEVQKTARRSPEQRPLEWTVTLSERAANSPNDTGLQHVRQHVRQHFHYTINTSNKMTQSEIDAVRRANANWIKCDPSEIEVVVINEALPI